MLDFGLVKARGSERSTELNLTRGHHPGGTPAFMSPEQVLGNRPVDARSDIYAVGCLAYWLVTGQLVFEGSTTMETMLRHVKDQPVPPSQHTEMKIPDALERLILDCLAKDPVDRPASADVVAERLAAIEPLTPLAPAAIRAWWDIHRPAVSFDAGRTPA